MRFCPVQVLAELNSAHPKQVDIRQRQASRVGISLASSFSAL